MTEQAILNQVPSLELEFEKDCRYVLTLTYLANGVAVNLTAGYTASFRVAAWSDPSTPLVSLSSPGAIALGADGTIVVTVSAADVADLEGAGPLVWELRLRSGVGDWWKVLKGTAKLDGSIGDA